MIDVRGMIAQVPSTWRLSPRPGEPSPGEQAIKRLADQCAEIGKTAIFKKASELTAEQKFAVAFLLGVRMEPPETVTVREDGTAVVRITLGECVLRENGRGWFVALVKA